MKATGVVRRIDDLGRVVIPKEIRKTLRIKERRPTWNNIGTIKNTYRKPTNTGFAEYIKNYMVWKFNEYINK